MRRILLAASVLILTGCNSGTMTVTKYDGATGRSETETYSKYYDAGDWVVPGKVGISVVVDHEKTVVPVVHGIQQSLGALGPEDAVARGKVTIYSWNPTGTRESIRVFEVVSGQSKIALKGKEVPLEPRSRTGSEVGYLEIFNYATEIPVQIRCESNGAEKVLSLTLKRRTHEELRRYFGPQGKPPYPWIQ